MHLRRQRPISPLRIGSKPLLDLCFTSWPFSVTGTPGEGKISLWDLVTLFHNNRPALLEAFLEEGVERGDEPTVPRGLSLSQCITVTPPHYPPLRPLTPPCYLIDMLIC